ncbi:acyl-CoA dehydrogenase family protein [Streptomyces paludis]|uniref:Acyl-CoA dehydrogenase n=1 Tax=Streptomyces paludis TaxID=2282738 RepID=A0A345HW38_9ACTN|nr:acyl-CoA dehydrogenase family protein [Streptomyces paludis]AXG80912.1 acyl-CoA dehydrogenase [Streptomyces paludis]
MTRSADHHVPVSSHHHDHHDQHDRHDQHDPLVARVERFSREVLLPRAVETDRHGVTAGTITALGSLGALNHLAPPEFGGAALGRAADRRLHELLAHACFNTWLVWAQHAPTVERVARLHAEGARHPWADRVLRGEVLVGAGLSDVRRFPGRCIAATRSGDGWRFGGTLSWVSGWGLNSVLVLAAVEAASERVVVALVPVGDRLKASALDLAAVAGSRTRRVLLDDVEVPDAYVLTVQPLAEYRAADRSQASDARPHVFGLARRVLDELREESGTDVLVERWAPRVAELRERAYALADEALGAGDHRHRLRERLAVKVAAGETVSALSRALLVARSGRGLTADNTAQLHARSALFVQVQGQTAEVRSAQLASAAAQVPGVPGPSAL